MTTKTRAEAAEEYASDHVRPDIECVRYAMRNPIATAKADFLAGIEWFIANELRGWLELARDYTYDDEGEPHLRLSLDKIIELAKVGE